MMMNRFQFLADVESDDLADKLLRKTIYLIALFPSAYFWWMLFDFIFFHSSSEACDEIYRRKAHL